MSPDERHIWDVTIRAFICEDCDEKEQRWLKMNLEKQYKNEKIKTQIMNKKFIKKSVATKKGVCSNCSCVQMCLESLRQNKTVLLVKPRNNCLIYDGEW